LISLIKQVWISYRSKGRHFLLLLLLTKQTEVSITLQNSSNNEILILINVQNLLYYAHLASYTYNA